MFGLFTPDPVITIKIDENPKLKDYATNILKTSNPVYTAKDKVTGKLEILPPPGKFVSHKGIILLLVGEYRRPDGETLSRFFVKRQELVPPGDLKTPIKNDFVFDAVDFPCSTYKGTAVNALYYIQVLVTHRMIDQKVEQPFDVVKFDDRVKEKSIHNEVGIRNILHIEFVFPKSQYDIKEAVVGAVYFILIKLRIVHMSLTFYRVENYSSDEAYIKKKTELKTIEIMDGAPCRGDHIPIRFFLGDLDLYPYESFKASKLVVEHYLRAILIDENGKKYYKRLKVTFDRLRPE
ncbi:Vacuolar protein sorting-associated protein 26 containing protein [Trichomonas vaginalis G3]|uniref:Vacuolar protein sorting-associated protein 26 containing protein n=1 Tax=Trichomonas vaginalis (strain ATCC PRA-98 / G3) TaxID=412133 RepID=A2E4T7_TRIV3|nr:retrograde transport, endosome to Golgi [Trichomonas vaginalis G3]EAY12276.1 Vacuolar protein sorting-associated protein 26 containing protein [Trichomonas vaginalis G3]KAI5552392.1 retrograde transport, endosome to Golgi [Trichomonas vaginalis G3]|eukprot:XP_001324499.1 Vacuolar protein sorting-associated protein 26 containing protein [Trichomonas vaginalis G3]